MRPSFRRTPCQLIVGLALFLATVASAGDSIVISGQSYSPLPLKGGDRCLVSGMPLQVTGADAPAGVAFLYRGRRITMARDALPLFEASPDRYFAALGPRSALFQEDVSSPVRYGWLLLGLYVLTGLVCGAVCVHLAIRKGHPPAAAFATGFLANVLGLGWTFLRPGDRVDLPSHLLKLPLTSDPINCPTCGRANHPSARRCKGCGSTLTPLSSSDIDRAERNSES